MKDVFLSKQDDNKIKKIEEVAKNLEEGSSFYYSITKLTSIKTLCKSHDDAVRFGVYIANLILKKVNSGYAPEYTDQNEWMLYKALLIESITVLNEHFDNIDILKDQLSKLVSVQNETRSGHYGAVIRTIYCNELLIIEKIIKCILSKSDYSNMAYRIARSYAEEYESRGGTGLVKKSIPMLKDIILFWRGAEGI